MQAAANVAGTVAATFAGNVGGSGGGAAIRIGADGGYTQYIDVVLDSADPDTIPDTTVRFTYTKGATSANDTIANNNNVIAGTTITGANTITLDASKGFTQGKIVFDFLTGGYIYYPLGSVPEGTQIVIGFSVIDNDGDTASGTNTIKIVDAKPIAVSDFDTLTSSTQAATAKFFEGNVINSNGTDGGGTQISGFKAGADGEDTIVDGADVNSIVFKGTSYNLTVASSGTANGGNYTITAGGELTWTNSSEAANVLVFHRDGYYKYTPPAAETGTLAENATQTISFATNATAATTAGISLSGYTRTANLNNTPDSTVTFSGNGAGVNGGGSNAAVDNLENFGITFNAVTYPQGVQNLVITVNAANSSLGNNGFGTVGTLQYSIYDIAGNLLGQYASDQEGAISIPTSYGNIGRVLIQANSTTGTIAGLAEIQQVSYNKVLPAAATVLAPDEVIQYTLTDKDTLSAPDSSSASLTLHVVTNEYAGTAGNDSINGSASNDLISGGAGDDTLNGAAGNDVIRGGAGNDSIDGGAGDDQLYGGDGNDTILGGIGNDYLYGEAGNDNLQGGDGNDTLSGGAGNDILVGGLGDDILIGGAGNDTLTGGAGSDTFKWVLADKGAAGAPALDTITDFDPATAGSGGDVLDLRDLLTGENHTTGTGNLSNYLHFEKIGADTVLHISSSGEFTAGYNAAKEVQTITLTGVDLVTGFSNDQQIIQDLLTKQKLITD